MLLLAQSYLLTNANSLVQQQIEIGRALSSTLELDAVLILILKHMGEIVPYDRAGVMLQEGNALKFVATRSFPASMRPDQLRVSIKESNLYRQIYHSKQPLSIPDVAQWPDWQYVEGLPAARSWMGAPLIHANEVIGMLSLTRTVANDYGEDELALVQTFAGQAAMALQNAQLYGEIKRFNQDLEDMVQERTKELQIACEKLERLDRSKSDFIGVASHELRTPLTVVSGYAQMLLQADGIKANPSYQQQVSGIHSGIRRMHEVVNSMLDVTKIDHSVLQLGQEPIQLLDLLKELEAELESLVAERSITLVTEDISVKDIIEVAVRDSGIGIDPKHHELIFEKFYQTGQVSLHSSGKTKFKGGGSGLGLAIARGIVQAHGGRIWVTSPKHDEEALPGSTFYVHLPHQF